MHVTCNTVQHFTCMSMCGRILNGTDLTLQGEHRIVSPKATMFSTWNKPLGPGESVTVQMPTSFLKLDEFFKNGSRPEWLSRPEWFQVQWRKEGGETNPPPILSMVWMGSNHFRMVQMDGHEGRHAHQPSLAPGQAIAPGRSASMPTRVGNSMPPPAPPPPPPPPTAAGEVGAEVLRAEGNPAKRQKTYIGCRPTATPPPKQAGKPSARSKSVSGPAR